MLNNYLITGIGLNLVKAPTIENYNTVSILDIEEKEINIIDFSKNLVKNITFYVDNYLQDRSDELINLWLKHAYGLNKKIIIKTRNTQETGVFKGLNSDGYIILEDGNSQKIFNVGDVWLL